MPAHFRSTIPITGAEMTLVAPLPSTWADGGIVLPTPEIRGS